MGRGDERANNSPAENRWKYMKKLAKNKSMAIFYVCAALMRRGLSVSFPMGVSAYDIEVKGQNNNRRHVEVMGSEDCFDLNQNKIMNINQYSLDEDYFLILAKFTGKLKVDYSLLNRRMARNLLNEIIENNNNNEKIREIVSVSWRELKSRGWINNWKEF